jgi:dimethylargininase
MLALTHFPSPRMADCLLTFVERSPIDCNRALRQHTEYCDVLRACGAEVRTLAVNRALPDCSFIEDTAVVLDEVAVLTRPGAAARRDETAGIERELRKYRPIERIAAPATLEGGDVLRVGRTLLVGLSSRTSLAGAMALDEVVCRYGYHVRTIPVHGCLHLKTACTALPDHRLLVNPAWFDVNALSGFELVNVPAAEPWGANIACLGNRVLAAAEHLQTIDLIRRLGFEVHTVAIDEFAKAEGGVTCLSILMT